MFSPAQVAVTHRFPTGTIVTLGNSPDNPKARIASWTLYDNNLAFFVKDESAACPPTPATLIYENKPLFSTVVHGFDSEDNALTTDDYPYGGYRTSCRWWIETATKGSQKGKQRFMQQTLNPKNSRWNKPHASVYCDIQLLYVDAIGHTHNYAMSPVYGGAHSLIPFLKTGMLAQLNTEELERLEEVTTQSRKFSPKDWLQFDTLHQLAKELNHPAYTDEDVIKLTKATQTALPNDPYIREENTREILDAYAKEYDTGKFFNF